MNLFVSTGRLCNDPETHTKGEKVYVTFNLAVQRNFIKANEPDSDYFRCVCFNTSKKFIIDYLRLGMKVEAQGELRTDSYEKDGTALRMMSYVIDRIGFAESKEANEKYFNRSEAKKGSDGLPAE